MSVAVASDAAFAFIYRANKDLLRSMGAEIIHFSPLEATQLRTADALYLPIGYPELFLGKLAVNTAMQSAIKAFHQAGKPIISECGGKLYLLDSLTDKEAEVAI